MTTQKLQVNKNKDNSKAFEQILFEAADKLRKNIDAAEYKHVVLGLIFLKFISDAFEELHQKLHSGTNGYEGGNPEDPDEYLAENVFFVPINARWSFLHSNSKQPNIGTLIDEAMIAIEKLNKSLKGILPIVYAHEKLDKAALGSLIDLIANIDIGTEAAKSKDLLGKVYEYFLGQFASSEGKKGGQFYTPKSVVRLMVEMIEPYKGRVYDPCCGSAGMFVMSEKFILEHSGNINDISVYGQESNQTTYKLSRMNLAIRGIEGSQIKWNNEGSFLNDVHPTLKADYILANPPFNQSDWGQELIQNDPRWIYGLPPSGNANFAWIQHMIYHLAPNGIMVTVLSNGSLSSQTGNEGLIRQKIVEANLLDCIVALPTQMFYNTGIPACLWLISRKRTANFDRKRGNQVLFINASNKGTLENKTFKIFNDDNIRVIADTYHNWRNNLSEYNDQKGFCKSASIDEIKKHDFILTPGRYVGNEEEVNDGIPFEEKISKLTAKLSYQMEESVRLDIEIKSQLAKIGINL